MGAATLLVADSTWLGGAMGVRRHAGRGVHNPRRLVRGLLARARLANTSVYPRQMVCVAAGGVVGISGALPCAAAS